MAKKKQTRSRYADILRDEAFKVVVCSPENEQLLIEIIELLIPGKHIKSLTFRDKEQHGLSIWDKNATFDLYCTSETGEQFIVEMQFAEQDSYADRMLCYASYPIRAQLAEKLRKVRLARLKNLFRRVPVEKMDYQLMPVYVVSLLNFSIRHQDERALEDGLISRYEILNAGNGEKMTEALHFVYLELGRLTLREDEAEKCCTLLEKFAFSMKYMNVLRARPNSFVEKLLVLLFDAAEYANMSIRKQQRYDKIMTTQIDIMARQEFARKKGVEQGRQEGAANERQVIARQMLAERIPAETVAKCTGLSKEDIAAL